MNSVSRPWGVSGIRGIVALSIVLIRARQESDDPRIDTLPDSSMRAQVWELLSRSRSPRMMLSAAAIDTVVVRTS